MSIFDHLEMVVLDKVVFWTLDCIQKKPGERSWACQTPGPGILTTGMVWCGVGGTRVMGYGDMVRTLVPHRGMGPGPPVPLKLSHFSEKWGNSMIFSDFSEKCEISGFYLRKVRNFRILSQSAVSSVPESGQQCHEWCHRVVSVCGVIFVNFDTFGQIQP